MNDSLEITVSSGVNEDNIDVIVISFDGSTLLLDTDEARTLAHVIREAADVLDSGTASLH